MAEALVGKVAAQALIGICAHLYHCFQDMKRNADLCEGIAGRVAYLSGLLETIAKDEAAVVEPGKQTTLSSVLASLRETLGNAVEFADDLRGRHGTWLGRVKNYFGAGSARDQLEEFLAQINAAIGDLSLCMVVSTAPKIEVAVERVQSALGAKVDAVQKELVQQMQAAQLASASNDADKDTVLHANLEELTRMVREIKQQQAERAVDTGLEATTVARSPAVAAAAVCAAPPADSAVTADAPETLSWDSVYVDEGPAAILGRGSFGVVVSGIWRCCPVAIKILEIANARPVSEQAVQTFLAEARLQQRLRHPSVVAVYGVVSGVVPPGHPVRKLGLRCSSGASNVTYAIIQERMHGSLRDVLHDPTVDLPIDQKRSILMQVAAGLEYLHRPSPEKPFVVAHADVKSGNCLVTIGGEVKVADFGFAKVKAVSERELAQHSTSGNTGTLLWRAPELLSRQPAHRSPATDAYAFGIVMWEVLTRKDPYTGTAELESADLDFEAELRHLVRQGVRPRLDLIPKDTPQYLITLMQALWSPDPAARPSMDVVWLTLYSKGQQGFLPCVEAATAGAAGAAGVCAAGGVKAEPDAATALVQAAAVPESGLQQLQRQLAATKLEQLGGSGPTGSEVERGIAAASAAGFGGPPAAGAAGLKATTSAQMNPSAPSTAVYSGGYTSSGAGEVPKAYVTSGRPPAPAPPGAQLSSGGPITAPAATASWDGGGATKSVEATVAPSTAGPPVPARSGPYTPADSMYGTHVFQPADEGDPRQMISGWIPAPPLRTSADPDTASYKMYTTNAGGAGFPVYPGIGQVAAAAAGPASGGPVPSGPAYAGAGAGAASPSVGVLREYLHSGRVEPAISTSARAPPPAPPPHYSYPQSQPQQPAAPAPPAAASAFPPPLPQPGPYAVAAPPLAEPSQYQRQRVPSSSSTATSESEADAATDDGRSSTKSKHKGDKEGKAGKKAKDKAKKHDDSDGEGDESDDERKKSKEKKSKDKDKKAKKTSSSSSAGSYTSEGASKGAEAGGYYGGYSAGTGQPAQRYAAAPPPAYGAGDAYGGSAYGYAAPASQAASSASTSYSYDGAGALHQYAAPAGTAPGSLAAATYSAPASGSGAYGAAAGGSGGAYAAPGGGYGSWYPQTYVDPATGQAMAYSAAAGGYAPDGTYYQRQQAQQPAPGYYGGAGVGTGYYSQV